MSVDAASTVHMGCALRWAQEIALRSAAALALGLGAPAGVQEAFAQDAAPAPTQAAIPEQPEPAQPTILDEMRARADAAEALVTSAGARSFLRATAHLPEIDERTLYIRGRGIQAEALTPAQHERLGVRERLAYTPEVYNTRFYYNTRYGYPSIYARPIDIVCALTETSGAPPLGEMRILDFGYGMIGQLRMLASLGADVVGVDIQPLLTALYSWPGDTGAIANIDPTRRDGSITLVEGSYPGDARVRGQVGRGFDLIITKNVLKRGYIHPERETTYPTIDLGVDDETFAGAWYSALAPGGLVMIYNISPKQNPDDQPFIPWADGRCPFDRALLEQTGFEILAYDQDDSETILDLWQALGLAGETPREELAQNLFAKYTLLRKPAR